VRRPVGVISLGSRALSEFQLLGRTILGAVTEFVYPPVCLICEGRLADASRRVCTRCLDRIPRKSPCEGRLAATDSGGRPLSYLAVWEYEEPLPTIIHAMKYRGYWKLAQALSRDMAAEILRRREYAEADLLVPVPLHRLRKRERGFNQSQKLAEGISEITAQPVVDALRRVRYTRTQTALSASDRRDNVAGAFRVRKGAVLAGRRVLLVDDVLTTGATAMACAQALWAAGVAEVRVAVSARP